MKKKVITLLIITSLCTQAPAHAGWLDANSFITSAYNAAKNNTYVILSAAAVLSGAGLGYWYWKNYYKPSTPPTRPDAPDESRPIGLPTRQSSRTLLTREEREAAFARNKQQLRAKAQQRQAELDAQEAVTEPVEEEINTATQPSSSTEETIPTENPPRTTQWQEGLRNLAEKKKQVTSWESQVPQSGGTSQTTQQVAHKSKDRPVAPADNRAASKNIHQTPQEQRDKVLAVLNEVREHDKTTYDKFEDKQNELFEQKEELEKISSLCQNGTFNRHKQQLRLEGLGKIKRGETIESAIERYKQEFMHTTIDLWTTFLKTLQQTKITRSRIILETMKTGGQVAMELEKKKQKYGEILQAIELVQHRLQELKEGKNTLV